MGFKRAVMYIFIAGLSIVSFQNCGQNGELGLEAQPDGKLAANANTGTTGTDGTSGLVDISDVQPPAGTDPVVVPPKTGDTPAAGSPAGDPKSGTKNPSVEHPKNGSCDDRDDKDTEDVADADDLGNIEGMDVSCTDLVRYKFPLIKASNITEFKNTRGPLKIENQSEVSGSNHRGILILSEIKGIGKLENIRSLFIRINAGVISNIDNIRALALIDAKQIDSIANYRGLGCVSAISTKSIENFRGVLEVEGDIKLVKNFRGILRVHGNVDAIENFRGFLSVSGKINSKKDVKVRLK